MAFTKVPEIRAVPLAVIAEAPVVAFIDAPVMVNVPVEEIAFPPTPALTFPPVTVIVALLLIPMPALEPPPLMIQFVNDMNPVALFKTQIVLLGLIVDV